MKLLEFIKDYWVLITCLVGFFSAFYVFVKTLVEATRCSLRNDILAIYDRCKTDKEITSYQLESIKKSSDIYKKLKGNSFVKEIVLRVSKFKIID